MTQVEYQVVTTPKADGVDAASVRREAARAFPGYAIEAVRETDESWEVRMARALRPRRSQFPFDQKDDEGGEKKKPKSEEKPDDDDDEDDEEESEGDEDKDGKKEDPVSELRGLVDQLQKVLERIPEAAEGLASENEEHEKTLQDVQKTIGDGAGGPPAAPPAPEDIGPTPGAPPVPRGPRGPQQRKRPPAGGPRQMIPQGFSHTEELRTSKRDAQGKEKTLAQAIRDLEADPEWQGYKVVTVTDEGTHFAAVVAKIGE